MSDEQRKFTAAEANAAMQSNLDTAERLRQTRDRMKREIDLLSPAPTPADIEVQATEIVEIVNSLNDLLARIQSLNPGSRHASLAGTHCEDVIFRLRAHLKEINAVSVGQEPTAEELALLAYARYG